VRPFLARLRRNPSARGRVLRPSGGTENTVVADQRLCQAGIGARGVAAGTLNHMHLLGRTAVNDRRLARRTGWRQGLADAPEKSGTAIARTVASRREMAACQGPREPQGHSVTPPGDRERLRSVCLDPSATRERSRFAWAIAQRAMRIAKSCCVADRLRPPMPNGRDHQAARR
jgi:hypothetical protein